MPIPAFDHNLVLPPHPGDPTLPSDLSPYPCTTLDASYHPKTTVEWTSYWISLFSHNRLAVWKGMLRVKLNTTADDSAARVELARVTP